MRRALEETVIEGVPNTLPVLREIVRDPVFHSGQVYTDYMVSMAS
jgi:biotin carboxylase